MKKYPIYYQGKEYEVRWDNEVYCGITLDAIISVYEVVPYTTIFKQNKIKYKKLETLYAHNLNELYDLNPNDTDLYIKQAKYAVYTVFEEIEEEKRRKDLEEAKKQKLREWDGVIE